MRAPSLLCLECFNLLRHNGGTHRLQEKLLALSLIIVLTGMTLKMPMCSAEHLSTLTGGISQSELLLTRFKGTLWHSEGLKLRCD